MNPEVSPRELNGGPTLGDAPDSNEEDTKHVDLEPANAADTFSSSNTILPHGMAHAMPLREASFTSSNEAILSPELVVIGLGEDAAHTVARGRWRCMRRVAIGG
jgi:hypothetical protein